MRENVQAQRDAPRQLEIDGPSNPQPRAKATIRAVANESNGKITAIVEDLNNGFLDIKGDTNKWRSI
ncbi:hypothetical protein V6N12_074716 [Hibiscus sabdariffa]|uniref:Uncharacterized protein n=1 Tax=Hibiscus sabdariffa TaxID=183260 RepID=A0ABR2BZT2_9ROSI